MSDDIGKKISEVLSNPEMMQKLNEVMSSLSIPDIKDNSISEDSNYIATNAQSFLSSINNADDKRITLLSALKPYLRESRANGVDTAIKILKMSKLTEIFKNIEF